MRTQFVPLPLMNPLNPSSFHIFIKALGTDNLYSFLPALCIWKRIFNRSRGDTTVLETAPAIPPAMKAATTGCATVCRICKIRGMGCGIGCDFPPAPATGTEVWRSTLMAKGVVYVGGPETLSRSYQLREVKHVLWDDYFRFEPLRLSSLQR